MAEKKKKSNWWWWALLILLILGASYQDQEIKRLEYDSQHCKNKLESVDSCIENCESKLNSCTNLEKCKQELSSCLFICEP